MEASSQAIAPKTDTATLAVPWYRTVTREQWKVLLAAKVGWMLDAMDFMLYAMVLGQLRAYFGFNDATAGMLGTVALVMSGVGGLTFGLVADRFGRMRALLATVLVFSLGSLGAATSQTLLQLMVWRGVVGLGMGGEWASGAVLVSESWPARLRNKAIGIMSSGWALGYITAAVLAGLFVDVFQLGPTAWRWLFAFGAVPALFTLWLRQNIEEPDVWKKRRDSHTTRRNGLAVIFGPAYRWRVLMIILLTSSVQFAYWGVFFWLPGFLARPIAQGGAGMSVVGSVGWIVPLQLGAYVGYLSFGFIADRIGRRRTFVLFMIAAAVLVPAYSQLARSPMWLMVLGPVLGFVGHGYMAIFGGLIAEQFPTDIRATGQGTTYNMGRLVGALAPYVIGVLAGIPGIGIGLALASTSAFFLAAALLVFALPDTSGQELES